MNLMIFNLTKILKYKMNLLNCSNKGHCPHFLTLFFFTVQLQIEEISRKLRTGDFGISQNPEERFDTRN